MAVQQKSYIVTGNDDLIMASLREGDTVYSVEAGAFRTIKADKFNSPSTYNTMGADSGDESNAVVVTGDTASRPTVTVGYSYFDTDLGIPIWYDGANWIDAAGTTV